MPLGRHQPALHRWQIGATFAEGDNKIANHCYIGRVYDAAHPAFNGYIGGIRIKKGAGVYTDTFTPPSVPWPLVSGGATFLPVPLRTAAAARWCSVRSPRATWASSRPRVACGS